MPAPILLEHYTPSLAAEFPSVTQGEAPWEILRRLGALLTDLARRANSVDYQTNDGVYVHRHATVEAGAVIKGPAFIAAGAFVAAHAYIRGEVFLGERSYVGPGGEVKASIVLSDTRLAHFNYVGDSVLGRGVNLEAGAVIANHFNERNDKTISVVVEGRRINIDPTKFGALVGDGCRIGANAVLSPGTILLPGTVVGRLELVQQSD